VIPIFWAIRFTGQGQGLDWVWEHAVPGVVGPALLLAWNPRFLTGAAGYPRRSTVALALLSMLSVAWFWSGWSLGTRYESASYVHGVCGLNIVVLAFAWVFALRARRSPSSRSTLLAHWTVVFWLVWVAFPWLGELP
jgi:hypothetical protein